MATILEADVYEIAKGGFRAKGTEWVGKGARGAVQKVPDGFQLTLYRPKLTRALNNNGRYWVFAKVGETYLGFEGKLDGAINKVQAVFYHVKRIPDPTRFYKTSPSENILQPGVKMGSRQNRAENPRESFIADTAIDVLVADLNSSM